MPRKRAGQAALEKDKKIAALFTATVSALHDKIGMPGAIIKDH